MTDHDEVCARCARPLWDQHFNEGFELFPTRRTRYCDDCFRHYGKTPGQRGSPGVLIGMVILSLSLVSTWLLTGEAVFLLTIPMGLALGAAALLYVRVKLRR